MNEPVDNGQSGRERNLEEAIVPIRPTASEGPPVVDTTFGRPPRHVVTTAVSLTLLALLVGVFFVLPRWVAGPDAGGPAAEADATVETVVDEQPAGPVLTEAELEALEASATDLLAAILELNEQLAARSAEVWGGEDWTSYTEKSRAGDDAFLGDDFVLANELYSEALDLGRGLIDTSNAIMAGAIDAGDAALAAGNAALAREQYQIVLTVDPEDGRAVRGLERAATLPDVLRLVREGDELAASGDLTAARDAYQEALDLDPDWAPASRALAEARTRIVNARFETQLSAGYAALADEDFAAADEAFRAALALRPGSDAAQDGLAQAEQGQKLDSIALAEARALAFERRELWDQAIARYEAALATDPTLAFAIEGLARSQSRADLDSKLNNLIDNPRLLLTDSMLADANIILGQARAVADTGERIATQTAQLERLIAAATMPVAVQFESDEQTEVTVYRIGRLGAFLQKQVDLRPGTYTVVGSRAGYRDVRTTLTILPGRDVESVRIVCVEPI